MKLLYINICKYSFSSNTQLIQKIEINVFLEIVENRRARACDRDGCFVTLSGQLTGCA